METEKFLSSLEGTTCFLNGQKGLHETEENLLNALENLGKKTLVLDNLFEEPEKLKKVLTCDNLTFSTTGLYAEQVNKLYESFEVLNYAPKNVLFLSENTALFFCEIARELKNNFGTKFFFLDFLDLALKKSDIQLQEVAWI